MKDPAALWQFIRRDRVGRWLGISWAVIAWFAFTWLSLDIFVVLVALSVAIVYLRRRRDVDELDGDELDDLF